ncbi:MAG: hypothetical protein ACREWG_15570 [Gammaproteobacteria bacterium]
MSAAPNTDWLRIANRVLVLGMLLEVMLLVLDYVLNYRLGAAIGPLRRVFNVTREDSAASWLGNSQTLLAGLTAWWIRRMLAARNARHGRGGWRVVWVLFLYLAVDDGVQLHERLGSAAYYLPESPIPLLQAFPSYPWQVLFVPVFGVLGLYVLVFLWRDLGGGALRFMVVAAMGLQGLAIILDFFEGLAPDDPLNLYRMIAERLDPAAFETVRHFGKAGEETIEMMAITLYWHVFLRRLAALAADHRDSAASAECGPGNATTVFPNG